MPSIIFAVAATLSFTATGGGLGIAICGERRSATPVLCTDSRDSNRVHDAAARVVSAAQRFGSAQGEAAAAWVEEALSTGTGANDSTELLQKQVALFEGCIIDEDDSGIEHCKELDAALSDLDSLLLDDARDTAKVDRALTRVRVTASRFGLEHARAAEAWSDQVRKTGSANPAALLEQQNALFGECLIDYEDGAPNKCIALQDSLASLQSALGIGGRVVSTGGLKLNK